MISVTYLGTNYNIPENNDRAWGDTAAPGLTAFLVALAGGQPTNSVAQVSIPGSVVNETVVLITSAGRAFTINSITTNTSAGTCTVAVKINGTNVTGLSAVAVTSTKTTTNATAAKAVSSGDRLTLVISAVSSATDFELSLNYS